ncbi:MAG: hypothetical protein P8172_06555 [Gammaproteobacteria bacterium]
MYAADELRVDLPRDSVKAVRLQEVCAMVSADKSSWVIGGTTLAGLGVGLIYVQTSALIFVAAILIGIGAGLVIAPFVRSRD